MISNAARAINTRLYFPTPALIREPSTRLVRYLSTDHLPPCQYQRIREDYLWRWQWQWQCQVAVVLVVLIKWQKGSHVLVWPTKNKGKEKLPL